MPHKIIILSLCFIKCISGFSQVIPSKIFVILKKENFVHAETYAQKKITSINQKNKLQKNRSKYNKKLIPYYYGLGTINSYKGDLIEAEKFFLTADSLANSTFTEKKPKDYYLNIKDDIAGIKLQEGHLNEAKEILDNNYQRRCEVYSEEFPLKYRNKWNPLKYRSDGMLAQYYFRKNETDTAIFFYERHILALENTLNPNKTDLNRLGDSYIQLAQIYLTKGNLNKALTLSKKGYKVSKHYWTKKSGGKNNFFKITSANVLAETYRQLGNNKKALRWNNWAYHRYQSKVGLSSYHLLPVLTTRALIYWSMNNIDSASMYFKKSNLTYLEYINKNFPLLSEYEREYFYNSTKSQIDLAKAFYYDLFFEKNVKDTAIINQLYELNLNTKGILLNSSAKFINQIYNSKDSVIIQKFNDFKLLKNQLAYINQTGDYSKNENRFSEIEEEIDLKERELRNLLKINQEKYISQYEVLKAIPDSAQLVDVMKCHLYKSGKVLTKRKDSIEVLQPSENTGYIYFFSNKDNTGFTIKNSKDGNLLDSKYYKLYVNSIKFNLSNPEVYDAYFKPIEENIHSNFILLSADGIYNLINLNTLHNGETFNIEKYKIYSITSGRDLLSQHQDTFRIEDIILFGRPDFTTYQGPNSLSSFKNNLPADLPGTEREILNIVNTLPEHIEEKVFLGKGASEKIVKTIPSVSIIHFATHGYFENSKKGNPMLNAGILLSISDSISTVKEDGILTAYEASNLNLSDTYLVVLSACETGLGKSVEGDGVWGLQRSFQVAGVNYVIMSLFKVDDEVTSLLMANFYKNLIEGNNIHDSFRKAQELIKSKYISPKLWGAFVLKGF